VLSAWSGIRPLVSDPNKGDTQSLARNHIVHTSKSGLITIAGGKWTTYRAMAAETIDEAVKGTSHNNHYRTIMYIFVRQGLNLVAFKENARLLVDCTAQAVYSLLTNSRIIFLIIGQLVFTNPNA